MRAALLLVALLAAPAAHGMCTDCACTRLESLPACPQCDERVLGDCYHVAVSVAADLTIASVAPNSSCLVVDAGVTLTGDVIGGEADECILVYGTVSGTISGGGGANCLFVLDGAIVVDIDDATAAANSSDFVFASDGATFVGGIATGAGDDTIVLRSALITGVVDSGSGADRIDVCGSAVDGTVVSGGVGLVCASAMAVLGNVSLVSGGSSDTCLYDASVHSLACTTDVLCPAPPSFADEARRKRTLPPACEGEVDVIVIMDHSYSITTAFSEERAAVRMFIDSLAPTANGTHVAVLAFALDTSVTHALSGDAGSLDAAVAAVTRTSPGVGAYTNMEKALIHAHALLDAGRVGAAKIIVLLTDGNPTVCETDTGCDEPGEGCNGAWTECPAANAAAAAAANASRAAGVEIFALGIDTSGGDLDLAYLADSIVSPPPAEHLFSTDNTTAVADAIIALRHHVCEPTLAPTAEPTGEPTAEPTPAPTTPAPTLQPTADTCSAECPLLAGYAYAEEGLCIQHGSGLCVAGMCGGTPYTCTSNLDCTCGCAQMMVLAKRSVAYFRASACVLACNATADCPDPQPENQCLQRDCWNGTMCMDVAAVPCDDFDVCTVDACVPAPNGSAECVATPIEDCCVRADDCPVPASPCAERRCLEFNGISGVCGEVALGYPCCESDANCTAPENACLRAECLLDTNTCDVGNEIAVDCSSFDTDADRCTAWACNATAGGECQERLLDADECPGACCFPSAPCNDTIDGPWCTEAGGVFAGVNTTCDACPSPSPTPAPTLPEAPCPNETACTSLGGFCTELTESTACPAEHSIERGPCDCADGAPSDCECACCTLGTCRPQTPGSLAAQVLRARR